MVVLKYWQLFHGEQYNLNVSTNQVLKYYNRDDNKGERHKNCEGQTNQIRSRTALPKVFFLECWVIL